MKEMEINIKELDVDLIAPSKANMYKSDQGGSKIVIIGKPGCLLKGTLVLMLDGSIRKVEDIGIGDQVMGDDGTSRRVQDTFHDYDEMYTVETEHGESYTVNRLHDLALFDTRIGDVIRVPVQDCFYDPDCLDHFRAYKCGGVDWPERETPVHPYTYGVKSTNILSPLYLINSKDCRLALLAGIIDRQMDVGDDPEAYCIVHKDVENVIFLARSLGFSAIRKDGKVWISGRHATDIPVKLFQKKHNTQHDPLLARFIVRHAGYDEYFGFELDGNHRFLLASFDATLNTGKTTLITSLMYEKSDIFPAGIVMSGTEDSNGHFRKIMPSIFVYNQMDVKQIENFIMRQKIAKKHLSNPWGLLLLDDCTDDPKIFNSRLFHHIFKNGRHWKMLFILSLQYCMDIKPVIRNSIDGTFILRESSLRNRKVLWENYASIIPDFKTFCTIMDGITGDYTALYIHNQATTNDWRDCVFWYKARPFPSNFKFGSKDIWKFANQRYDPNYRDPFIV